MNEHLDYNKQHKHGRADYSLEKFGLSEEIVGRVMKDYKEEFGDSNIQSYEHLPFQSRFSFGQNCLHLMTGFLKMHPDYAQTILNNYRGVPLSRSIKMLKMIQQKCHSTCQNSFHLKIFEEALDATKEES
jgi:hypothetical protein